MGGGLVILSSLTSLGGLIMSSKGNKIIGVEGCINCGGRGTFDVLVRDEDGNPVPNQIGEDKDTGKKIYDGFKYDRCTCNCAKIEKG